MLDWLLLILVLCVFTQPDARRMKIAAVYVFATVGYDVSSTGLEGLWYFMGAACVDLGVIVTIGIFGRGYMALWLQCVSCLSILYNFAGWLAYEGFHPPEDYTNVYLWIYTLAILGLLTGGFHVVGVRTGGGRRSSVRVHNSKGRNLHVAANHEERL